MANNARAFVIRIQDDMSPSLFNLLGGLVDCDLAIGDAPDDITSKGSNGARTLHTAGAIKTYDFSGNLVVSSESAWVDLRTAKESSDPKITAEITDGVKTYTGVFAIETLNLTGGNAGAVRASIDLKSAGAIAVTP